MQGFIAYEDVVQVLSHGQTKSSVVLKNGIQVDLRLVAKESFGAALHYFTGSKAHNIAVRRIAQDLGLKINEYGVFKDEHFEAGTSEQEVYACVGLPYFEPELREDRGEIQAAQENQLPELVGREHLRGDLHVHSNYSDGVHSLQELAQAAKNFGYEYLAVTDHTQNLSVAKGLDPKRLSRQIEEIDRVNAEMPEIVLLKSAEVDILEDGSLDLPDWILKELDLCVCSVHTAFRLSKKKQTERILRAMDNPYFNIFGHPSGRLIGSRPAYELEMARILQGAKERGCVLELNSQPDRLDLDDVHCRAAKEAGVKVAISTDAHRRENLNIIRFGIGQARRGWLEPEDVINTRPLRELRELIRR